MKSTFRRIALFTLLAGAVTVAACSKGGNTPGANGSTKAVPKDMVYQEKVATKLHRERMITIPEVQQMSGQFVEKYRSGQMKREDAAQAFYEWLQKYEASHPKEVEAARKGIPSTPAGAPPAAK